MTRLTATNTDAALDKITHIMTELALHDIERDALASHLYRVSVPKLVRGEASTHACIRGQAS